MTDMSWFPSYFCSCTFSVWSEFLFQCLSLQCDVPQSAAHIPLRVPCSPCEWFHPVSLFSLWPGMLMCPALLSLAGTVPLNSQLISCQSYSCGLPQALKLRMSFLNFWSPSMVPPFVSSPTPERNLWFVLDFYLSLNPCSTPSPHLVNQNGPADLLPEYSWTIFLLYYHYYYYSNSHQFPTGLLQCLFGRRG